MQVQLAEKKVYCHISLISVVNTDHPSREKLYYHSYDELGILQPSKYFNAVGRQLTRLIKLVATMPTTSVHLLRREGKEGYINYLVYVIQTTNKQLDNDILRLEDEFGMLIQRYAISGPKDSKSEMREKFQKLLRVVNDKLIINAKAVKNQDFIDYGFELSPIEDQFLLDALQEDFKPELMPIIQSGSFALGSDIFQRPVQIIAPSQILVCGDYSLLSPFTAGIVITNQPDRLISSLKLEVENTTSDSENNSQSNNEYNNNIDPDNHNPVYLHRLDLYDNPIGINLLQLYHNYPGILIKLIETVARIEKNWRLQRSFLSVVDEVFTTVDEELIGMLSIESLFLEDEFHIFEKLSDQQSKYELQQILSKYFGTDLFSTHNLDDLHLSGIHILDVSQLPESIQIIVDILFRLLRQMDVFEGCHVSDVLGPLLRNKDYTLVKQVHQAIRCDNLVVFSPEWDLEYYKSSEWDLILTPVTNINNRLKTWDKNLIGFLEFEHLLEQYQDAILMTDRRNCALLSQLLPSSKIFEGLHPMNITIKTYDEDLEVVLDLDEEEERDILLVEEYLPHYYIISLSASMHQHRRYQRSELEQHLGTEEEIITPLELMNKLGYLHIRENDGKIEYDLNARARSYVHTLEKHIKESAIEVEYDNALSYVNQIFVKVLAEKDPENQLEMMLTLYQPIKYLSDKLDFEGLYHHYLGLVASIKTSISNDDAEEQLEMYLRDITKILDLRSSEEEVFRDVMDKLQDEDVDLSSAIDEVIETERVQDILDEVLNTEVAEEVAEFIPETYEEVGIWYPTEEFVTSLLDPVQSMTLSIEEIFVHQFLYNLNSQSRIEMELIVEKLGLSANIIDNLETKGLINGVALKEPNYQTYPTAKSIDTDLIRNGCEQVVTKGFDAFISQQFKQQLKAYLINCSKEIFVTLVDITLQIQKQIPSQKSQNNNSSIPQIIQQLVIALCQHLLQKHDTPEGNKIFASIPVLPESVSEIVKNQSRSSKQKVRIEDHVDTTDKVGKAPPKVIEISALSIPKPTIKEPTKKASTAYLPDEVDGKKTEKQAKKMTNIQAESLEKKQSKLTSESQSQGLHKEIIKKQSDDLSKYQIKEQSSPTEPIDQLDPEIQSFIDEVVISETESKDQVVSGDLPKALIEVISRKLNTLVDGSPAELLSLTMKEVFDFYGHKSLIETLTIEDKITMLKQASQHLPISFEIFFSNYADIDVIYSQDKTTYMHVKQMYIDRLKEGLMQFKWNKGIVGFLSKTNPDT